MSGFSSNPPSIANFSALLRRENTPGTSIRWAYVTDVLKLVPLQSDPVVVGVQQAADECAAACEAEEECKAFSINYVCGPFAGFCEDFSVWSQCLS